jgi:hypothetical protein
MHSHPKLSSFAVVLAAALATLPAVAAAENEPAERPRGDHPAVVVQRLQAQATYDYASKFYPHPAWLHLRPAAEERAAAGERAVATAGGARGGAAVAPERRDVHSR